MNPDLPEPQPTTASKPRWFYAALYLGIWTLPGLMSAAQIYSDALIECKEISWRDAVMWQMPVWYLWALLTPLILWLGRRFPLERHRLAAGLRVHIPASLAVALFYMACATLYKGLIKTTPFSLKDYFYSTLINYLHFDALIYWAILGVGYWFEYHRRYHDRELAAVQLERELTQAQLQALKMQLHPHFLFNTLNALSVLVRKQDTPRALTMISRLSDLLRYTLDQLPVQEVPLRQELDFIKQYVDIEQIRFADRLSVQFKAAPNTMDAMVPQFILQPLVENAIRHGIAASTAQGVLEIGAMRNDGQLLLEVRDNGPGLHSRPAPTENGGLGLANTRARLQQLYGSASQFDLRNANGKGAVATVTIPFRTFSEAEKSNEAEAGENQNTDR